MVAPLLEELWAWLERPPVMEAEEAELSD